MTVVSRYCLPVSPYLSCAWAPITYVPSGIVVMFHWNIHEVPAVPTAVAGVLCSTPSIDQRTSCARMLVVAVNVTVTALGGAGVVIGLLLSAVSSFTAGANALP